MHPIIAMLLLSAVYAGAVAAAPHQHEPSPVHSPEHRASATAADPQGKRWPADASLRQGMQQIRSARAHDVRSTADAVALAKAIDASIAYIIRNCSLPTDADAALHGVIGKLGGAANALRREDDLRAAIAMLDAAIERYAQLFDETAVR